MLWKAVLKRGERGGRGEICVDGSWVGRNEISTEGVIVGEGAEAE